MEKKRVRKNDRHAKDFFNEDVFIAAFTCSLQWLKCDVWVEECAGNLMGKRAHVKFYEAESK